MPTISIQTVVPLNGSVENVLTGSQFEFLPYDAAIDFGLVASATGLLLDVNSGQDILMESGVPSTANRIPIWPDDYSLNDVAAAGERLKVRARNTTAGNLTLFTALRINPV